MKVSSSHRQPPLKAKPQSEGEAWLQKEEEKSQRLEEYVRRNGGEFSEDGSGEYLIGKQRYRTFPHREGYDENFLGTEVKLPELDESIAPLAATRIDDPGNAELEYTHFSVVQNKQRRMPFFTAVNIDGSSSMVARGKVKWAGEGRILPQHQLGNIAYVKNDLDRGHMVHGQSPAWGALAEMARADSYVYSNAALQHKGLNQEEWVDLENQLLDEARDQGRKVSVFAGPVFKDDDKYFDNKGRMPGAVQMPRSFWKVVVWQDPQKGLQTESYLMSQEDDLAGKGGGEYRDGADLRPFRVPLSEVEALTKLRFESLHESSNSSGK